MKQRRFWTAPRTALPILFLAVVVGGCQSAPGPADPPPQSQICAPPRAAKSALYADALRAKAAAEGKVRVIIEVARPQGARTTTPRFITSREPSSAAPASSRSSRSTRGCPMSSPR